jgi:DNA-binding response OmpR family regulator
MDGYEATKIIRERERELNLRRTPIAALTANAMQGDREQCLVVGMDDYLPKPFGLEQLLATMERWLNNGQHRRTGEETGVAGEALPVALYDRFDPAYASNAMGGRVLYDGAREAIKKKVG